MYCPQCGQQQSSGDMRFCSRCGFRLHAVSELLASNGLTKAQSGTGLFKGKAPIGAKIMFFGIALVPFSIVLAIALDTPGPFAFPFLAFMIGLTQFLYVQLFGTKPRLELREPPTGWGTTTQLNSPYPESVPLQLEERRATTSEIAQPTSVTEHTTKLLDVPESR